jgi:hypothetical protein
MTTTTLEKPDQDQKWIDNIELDDANIKWNWSHFDGKDMFSGTGDYNFTVIFPEEQARQLMEEGWNIREHEGYEEGDPPEFTLKVKISYRFEEPKIFLLKGENRKIKATEKDLPDINRATCERIDVIIQPSRWVHGQKSGISAYVKELYATIKQSRFEERYADYEEV